MAHYSFIERNYLMDSGNHSRTHNERQNNMDFEDGSLDWDASSPTFHSPEECQECRLYNEHLRAASFSEPALQTSFLHAIHIGRRLQREEDSGIISRYRSRLRRVDVQYRDSLLLKVQYRSQMEVLERELISVKDKLIAVQMSYEELSMARVDDIQSRTWSPASPSGNAAYDPTYSPSSPIATFPSDDANVPGITQETIIYEEPPVQFIDGDDDDDFQVLQQLQLMGYDESRPVDENLGWSYLRGHSFSDDEIDGFISSGWDPDTESLLWSLSSTSSQSSESILANNSSDSGMEVPTTSASVPDDSSLNIGQLTMLMTSASESRNNLALKRIKVLIREAERTPKKMRNAVQLYLLTHWRRSPIASSLPTPEVFVDASSYGIGFIFNDEWLAWTFISNHPHIPVSPGGIIMSWAELIAVELGILTLITCGYKNTRILVRSDNEGVVSALKKRSWTKSHGLDIILNRILRLCEEASLELEVKWVWTKENPADGPSRGTYPPRNKMLARAPAIPHHLVGFLRQVGEAKA